jgi:hypothetical protein
MNPQVKKKKYWKKPKLLPLSIRAITHFDINAPNDDLEGGGGS